MKPTGWTSRTPKLRTTPSIFTTWWICPSPWRTIRTNFHPWGTPSPKPCGGWLPTSNLASEVSSTKSSCLMLALCLKSKSRVAPFLCVYFKIPYNLDAPCFATPQMRRFVWGCACLWRHRLEEFCIVKLGHCVDHRINSSWFKLAIHYRSMILWLYSGFHIHSMTPLNHREWPTLNVRLLLQRNLWTSP